MIKHYYKNKMKENLVEAPWIYPSIEICANLHVTSFTQMMSCKFNLFNKLEFPIEAAR